MQEQNLRALLHDALTNPMDSLKAVKPRMKQLAKKNEGFFADKKLPNYERTPTTDELIEMRQWAIDYKKLHKQASKREVRKAVQKHFHIRIYR